MNTRKMCYCLNTSERYYCLNANETKREMCYWLTAYEICYYLNTSYIFLSNEINLFKPALKRFLLVHSFYSVEEYLDYRYN